jgi:hypothetical protein
VNNEVSVAELYLREGRTERFPPPSGSRWRLITVMAAVVIGCGAAALLLRPGASVEHGAQQARQLGSIEMPQRTAGIAGADATPDQVPTKGPDGAGHGAAPPATDTTGETISADRPAETPATSSQAGAPETAAPRSDPSRTPSTRYSAKSPTPPRTATSDPKPCWFFVFC